MLKPTDSKTPPTASIAPTLAPVALAAGLLAACAGRAVVPDPVEPEAVANLLREGRIDWDRAAGDQAGAEGAAADSVIGIGGGAGGQFGGRAAREGSPPAARADGAVVSSPAAEASLGASLSSLGYVGEGLEVAAGFELERKTGATRVWQQASVTPNSSRLTVGENDVLPLRGASTEVYVEGFRARVVTDLVYLNDRDRQLEGSFELRLPDGASPYYLAFGAETWESAPPTPGEWTPRRGAEEREASGSSPAAIAAARAPFWAGVKEARMVPRDRGAQAYEETVARQVDPALLEWGGAGVFRAKVFPLMPGELHRIVVGYDLDLLRTGPETFELALGLASAPSHPLDLHLAIPPGATARYELGDGGATVGGAPGVSQHVPLEARDGEVLRIAVEGLGTPLLVAPGAAGRGLFAASVDPRLEAGDPVRADRAVFLLDTSRSAADSYGLWVALLEGLLTGDAAPREFALLAFDVDQAWLTDGFVRNDAAGRRAALDRARGQWLAGATDLASALAAGARPSFWRGDPDWDLFLLGDGAATWGQADAARIAAALDAAPDAALFAYRTGAAGADTPLLEQLASRSGGAVFNLAGESAVAAAAVAHASQPYALRDVRMAGTSDLLLAGRPRFVYPGQALTVVGRGRPGVGAVLELDLERGGAIETVSLRLQQELPGQLAERTFGEVAVEQLEQLDPASRRDAENLALHFRVPGATCSLLMLETEAEYEAYGLSERDTDAVAATLPVAEVIAQLWSEAGALLADPRARLAGFLERLAALPSVRFEAADDILATLATVGSGQLDVRPEPLTTLRMASQIDAALRAAADADELDEAGLRQALAAAANSAEFNGASQLRALSTVAETHAGDPAAARELGFDALALGFPGHAYHQLLRAAEARPFEPSTYLALAEAASAAGNLELAWIWFEVALGGTWNGRFGDFRNIAAVSCLHWLRAHGSDLPDAIAARLSELAAPIAEAAGFAEADLVVFVQWSTDRTDVDLHVLEPSGERCYYGHKRTAQGGQLSADVTRGLGPEMFVLPDGEAGDYGIGVHYFASDRNKTALRTRVHVSVYRDFGRTDEAHERRTLTLADAGGMNDIGILTLE